MQHFVFYSMLCLAIASVLAAGWKQGESDRYYQKWRLRQCLRSWRWDLYSYYVYFLTAALGFILWPFIDHPFVFSFTFVGIFHHGWDIKIVEFIKNSVLLVELNEWLGINDK